MTWPVLSTIFRADNTTGCRHFLRRPFDFFVTLFFCRPRESLSTAAAHSTHPIGRLARVSFFDTRPNQRHSALPEPNACKGAHLLQQTHHSAQRRRMARSEQDGIFGHIPPEVVFLILARLDDRSFWAARRTHRVFRVEHSASEIQRRVAHWWLRTHPEQAIARGRTDVLLFLQRRRRIPPDYSPWLGVVCAGHVRALETALAAFPANYDQWIIVGAVLGGHTDLVLRMHSLREFSIADSISAALRAERAGMALALCRAATVKEWSAWARVAARHGHLACLQLFLGHCHAQSPTPTDLAIEAVHAVYDDQARRTLGFLIDRFPNTIEWHQVFDVALGCARVDICTMAHTHASPSLDLQSRLDQACVYTHGHRVRILLRLDPTLDLQRALDHVARKIEGKCLAQLTIGPSEMSALCALVEADPARTLDARRAFETFRAGGMIGHAAYLTARYPVHHGQ